MKLKNYLLDGYVNFVCHKCQQVYYQIPLEEYEMNAGKTTRDARKYKQYYHKCPWQKGGNHVRNHRR